VTIGFNRLISDSALIFIDDNDNIPPLQTGPSPQPQVSTGTDSVLIKNFSGTTFGSRNSNQYAVVIDRRRGTSPSKGSGAITFLATSETSPNTAWYSGKNLVHDNGVLNYTKWQYSSAGGYDSSFGGSVVQTANVTIRTIDSGDAIIRLTTDTTTLSRNSGADQLGFTRQYTFYPNGRIYEEFKVVSATKNLDNVWPGVAMKGAGKSVPIHLVTKNNANNAQVATNQIKFPVLIRLNPGTFSRFSEVADDGSDIRFYKADGVTALSYEIERWKHVSEHVDSAEIWVKVDTVYGYNNRDTTTIRMTWGNSGGSQSSGSAVFDTSNGFAAVWHLTEEQAGSNNGQIYLDATVNANHGKDSVNATGKMGAIGKGQQFDNAQKDCIRAPYHASLKVPVKSVSASAWVYSLDQTVDAGLITYSSGGNAERYMLGLTTGENPRFRVTTTGGYFQDEGNAVNTSQWYHVYGTYDGSYIRTYIDGVLQSTPVAESRDMTSGDSPVLLGRRAYGDDRWFKGYMDEGRIERVVRSDDWIKLCYQNQKLPTITTGRLVFIDTVAIGASSAIAGYWNATTKRAGGLRDASVDSSARGVAFGLLAYGDASTKLGSAAMVADTALRLGADTKFMFRIPNTAGTGTPFQTGDLPYSLGYLYDIRGYFRDTTTIKKAVHDVLHHNAVSFETGSVGSAVITDIGDLDQNGFNDAQGCWVVAASNNTVKFKLTATTDTVHYSPAFKITNYFAKNKPQHVYVHSHTGISEGSRDTIRLLEGYQYAMHHNKAANTLLIQLDTTFTDSTWIFISSDITLAVTMSSFWGSAGDGSDTLYWITESEFENLGFNLYRRVKPSFMDSLSRSMQQEQEIADDDTTLGNAHQLFKLRKLSIGDTAWEKVNLKLIPGAPQGVSYGRRLYRNIDYKVYNEVLYEYKLVAVDYQGGRETYGPVELMPMTRVPRKFMLLQNYPNPFRTMTVIRFELPVRTRMNLSIYDFQGRLIKRLITPDRRYNPGYYRVTWDGKDEYGRPMASGPYIYRLTSPRFATAKIMIVTR
jgi:hypothetical protein